MAKIIPVITDKKTGAELWTADQAAEHCGCSVSTWRVYLKMDYAPKPVAQIGTSKLWLATDVKQWHKSRPRAGK